MSADEFQCDSCGGWFSLDELYDNNVCVHCVDDYHTDYDVDWDYKEDD